MSKTLMAPSMFTDIYKVHQDFQRKFQGDFQENSQDNTIGIMKNLKSQRDYLCFMLPYLLGRPCEQMLSMSFKELAQQLPSKSWRLWLKEFEQQLQKKTPWFHTARFNGIREGLSRRGLEVILKNQSLHYFSPSTAWSYKSLRQAYVLKSLQTGVSELKIKYHLNMRDQYNFKNYYDYLGTRKESQLLYLDISP